MTRPDSDDERPGWRIRRAKPSATRPFMVLLVLVAGIFGGAGYVLGSSSKDEAPRAAAARTEIAPTLAPTTVPSQRQTPAPTSPTQAPIPTAVVGTPVSTPAVSGNAGDLTATPRSSTPVVAPSPRVAPSQPTGQTTYTVQPGDNLSVIAEQQKIPAAGREVWLQKVRELNGLQNDDIQAGKQLILPPAP